MKKELVIVFILLSVSLVGCTNNQKQASSADSSSKVEKKMDKQTTNSSRKQSLEKSSYESSDTNTSSYDQKEVPASEESVANEKSNNYEYVNLFNEGRYSEALSSAMELSQQLKSPFIKSEASSIDVLIQMTELNNQEKFNESREVYYGAMSRDLSEKNIAYTQLQQLMRAAESDAADKEDEYELFRQKLYDIQDAIPALLENKEYQQVWDLANEYINEKEYAKDFLPRNYYEEFYDNTEESMIRTYLNTSYQGLHGMGGQGLTMSDSEEQSSDFEGSSDLEYE